GAAVDAGIPQRMAPGRPGVPGRWQRAERLLRQSSARRSRGRTDAQARTTVAGPRTSGAARASASPRPRWIRRLRRRGHLGARYLPCPATGRGVRAPGGSSRGDPAALLQRPGARTQHLAGRGTRHQRAARRRLCESLMLRSACFALALLLCASIAPAQDASTIYRCTAASGEVTIQNGTPWPAGTAQETRKVEALPTRPAPPPATLVVVEEPPAWAPQQLSDFEQVAGPQDEPISGPPRPDLPRPARIAEDARLPPPPIYQCET